MKGKQFAEVLCCALAVLMLAGPATADGPETYDVYKYSQPESDLVPIPDVDLADHGHGGMNYQWLATAGNILGGAGYGIGVTPQERADQIYLQLVGHLGGIGTCEAERAVNYWLYTFGRNPDMPEYQPANTYTDVTVVEKGGGFLPPDYDFLLDELDRCQYVAVRWYGGDNWSTMIGGDYGGPGTSSIWHDADQDAPDIVATIDDDVYMNDFSNGRWDLQGRPGRVWADKYVTLCPGLFKPDEAVMNYDVAWYWQDQDHNGIWDLGFREAGEKAGDFDNPCWEGPTTVRIDNEFEPLKWKEVYLLVDYVDRVADRELMEMILLEDDMGNVRDPSSVTPSDDDGQLMFVWILDYQPEFEKILFPNDKYNLLDDYVKDWNIATICVPEPATLSLLVFAGLAVIRRRRK